ncbi:hypothetical protein SNE40_007658 [Patella caerulea]|uniref:Large ribosomal subunit protein mL38 n=1 Tax=Patella caerulea TaxID=87958 RepID=A0AAN8JX95_PATCE
MAHYAFKHLCKDLLTTRRTTQCLIPCYRLLYSSIRGKPHDIARSLKDRLAEIKERKEKDVVRNNIGFPLQNVGKHLDNKWLKERQKYEKNSRLKKLEVNLEEVRQSWVEEQMPNHSYVLAEHYGIYKDLFDHCFFYPKLFMDIEYDVDEEFVMPLYLGNRITPTEAQNPPHIKYNCDPNTWWTLVMSSPDGHLEKNDAECLHWMIGNISGSDVSTGEVLCDYLPPFPPRGTGLLRYVFVLYEQTGQIDYSSMKKTANCISLSERTFSTVDFYGRCQDKLTPAALSFFQAEWDPSVQKVFREILDMKEPVFEFIHPPNYHPNQTKYPHKQPFNLYLNRYRDVKDIQEEVLKEKLKNVSPFQPPSSGPEYPLAKLYGLSKKPSWQRLHNKHVALKRHQWKDL